MNLKTTNKAFLIILDGYGHNPDKKGNAVIQAKKPFIDKIQKDYPTTLLKAHGHAVGLPNPYMGNSEVGHFTIGSGRITFQSLEEINQNIKSKEFFKKKELISAIEHVKKHNSALHLLGMISDEGVHSHINHLFALLKLCKEHDLKKVYIHAITDGRDVPERSAKKYLSKILKTTKKLQTGEIVSIIGRYYAMDRDQNWNRTQKAYKLLTEQKGINEKDTLKAIDNAYKRGIETDYYIDPITIQNQTINKNDAVIFFNFRTDRARQLTEAFTNPQFKEFKTKKLSLHFVCFGPYAKNAPIVFPAPKIKNNLSEIISKNGLHQLRIAETEKYAHVTFFFNSQIKEPYKNENRILIDSPKVPSYDQKPEMSALKVTKILLKEIKSNKHDLIILNFANPDLVGHSGDLKATIKCIEVLDKCLSEIIPLAIKNNYNILLTADHGNAEQMLYKDGTVCPAHSLNPVPFTLITEKKQKIKLKKNLGLSSIAPTILELMNIKKPKEMTGKSIIDNF